MSERKQILLIKLSFLLIIGILLIFAIQNNKKVTRKEVKKSELKKDLKTLKELEDLVAIPEIEIMRYQAFKDAGMLDEY